MATAADARAIFSTSSARASTFAPSTARSQAVSLPALRRSRLGRGDALAAALAGTPTERFRSTPPPVLETLAPGRAARHRTERSAGRHLPGRPRRPAPAPTSTSLQPLSVRSSRSTVDAARIASAALDRRRCRERGANTSCRRSTREALRGRFFPHLVDCARGVEIAVGRNLPVLRETVAAKLTRDAAHNALKVSLRARSSITSRSSAWFSARSLRPATWSRSPAFR